MGERPSLSRPQPSELQPPAPSPRGPGHKQSPGKTRKKGKKGKGGGKGKHGGGGAAGTSGTSGAAQKSSASTSPAAQKLTAGGGGRAQPSAATASSAEATAAVAAEENTSQLHAHPTYIRISPDDVTYEEHIGVGQFGSVYRGTWKKKTVAIKKTICFENEAKLLASLRHRNIVQFYGANTTVADFFVVIEYAEHGSLYHFFEKLESVEFQQLINWSLDVCCGMEYLHDGAPERIIHRDLKSLNVLVNYDFSLKICDFGSSRAVGYDTVNLSTFAGTVAWMAPEVIRNEKVTEKCDVWSFGVILWELLTLEVPFEGLDQYAVIWLVASHGVKLPVPECCPHKFAALLNSCWQKQKDRPSFKQLGLQLSQLAVDDGFRLDLQNFAGQQPMWHNEIQCMVESYRQLESDHAHLNDRMEEIKQRELILAQREQALLHQVQLQSFQTPATPTPPATPVRHTFSFPKVPMAQNPVRLWTPSEVASWVSILPEGLHAYEPVFREHHINGRVLLLLTNDELKTDLGIKSFGHRKLLMDTIERLERSADFPPLEKRSSSAAGDLKVQFVLCVQQTHDKMHHRWEITLAPREQEAGAIDFIQHVEFHQSHGINRTNLVIQQEPPYVLAGECVAGLEVMCAVKYKPTFRRKTTKISYPIVCGNNQKKCVTIQLKPKATYQQSFAAAGGPDVMFRAAREDVTPLSPTLPATSAPLMHHHSDPAHGQKQGKHNGKPQPMSS